MACCCNQCNPTTCPGNTGCYTPCRCVNGQCVACSPAACPNGTECSPPCQCINGECKACYTCDSGFVRVAYEVEGADCSSNQLQYWYCAQAITFGADSCTNRLTNYPLTSGQKKATFATTFCGGSFPDQEIIEFTIDDSNLTTFPLAGNPPCGSSGLTVSNVTTYWRFNQSPYTQCNCRVTRITTTVFNSSSDDIGCIETNNFPRTA